MVSGMWGEGGGEGECGQWPYTHAPARAHSFLVTRVNYYRELLKSVDDPFQDGAQPADTHLY